jgi:hypothetical protein
MFGLGTAEWMVIGVVFGAVMLFALRRRGNC